MSAKIRDYTGKRFNHLTILHLSRTRGKGKHALWLCRCDCGNLKELSGHAVARSRVKTCGKCQYTEDLKALRVPNRPSRISSGQRGVYSRYVYSAVDRGLSWELTPEQLIELTQKNCFYCGQEPAQRYRRTPFYYNGVDRVDNTAGYTLTNCVACCIKCNRMKLDLNIVEFLSHLALILETTKPIVDELKKSLTPE
jgi:hypothetical protein